MPGKKTDIKNNPFYQEGHFWARRIIPHIANTRYGNLKAGVESKKELVEDLKENFGWDETHKDIAEALGIIAAWEEELAEQEANSEPILITIKEIDQVAGEMNVTILLKDAEKVQKEYTEYMKEDPDSEKISTLEFLIIKHRT